MRSFVMRCRPRSAGGWGELLQGGVSAARIRCSDYGGESVYHRTVVVGNAADALHPIAGQGFNLGLRDVMSPGGNAGRGTGRGARILAPGTYYRAISSVVRLTGIRRIGVTNGSVHVFANRWVPLVIGRNIGLMAMELLPPPARDGAGTADPGWAAR